LIVGSQFCTGILKEGREGEKLKNFTVNIRYQETAVEDTAGWRTLRV
jgi:hypothetical protein